MVKKTFLALALAAAAVAGFAAAPPTIIWDGPDLDRARQAMAAGDPVWGGLRTELIAAADKALAVKPGSVLDKELTAPTGDKKDFLSWAIYWWPDPAKPDGRPYIGKDGQTNPEAVGSKTDAAAASAMLRHTPTLALGYFYIGNRAYADHAAAFLRKWFVDPATRMNPNFDYGEVRPGHNDERGTYTGMIIFSFRMHLILDSLALIRDSGSWSAADEAAFRNWLSEYLGWLDRSPLAKRAKLSSNNHATYFAGHLAMIQLYLGDPAAARATVEAAFARSFAPQFGDDGIQRHELKRTLSFSYSTMNMRGWLNLAVIGEKTGFDAWRFQTPAGVGLRRALLFFAPFADPETPWPHTQIKKLDRKPLWEPMVRAARHYPEEPVFRTAVEQLDRQPSIQLEKLYFPWFAHDGSPAGASY